MSHTIKKTTSTLTPTIKRIIGMLKNSTESKNTQIAFNSFMFYFLRRYQIYINTDIAKDTNNPTYFPGANLFIGLDIALPHDSGSLAYSQKVMPSGVSAVKRLMNKKARKSTKTTSKTILNQRGVSELYILSPFLMWFNNINYFYKLIIPTIRSIAQTFCLRKQGLLITL